MAIEHIVKTPGICGGRARIDGTRITVELVVRLIQDGAVVDELIEGYAHIPLSRAQIYAALAYYHDHRAEIDEEIARIGEMEAEGLAEYRARAGRPARPAADIDHRQFATAKEAARELGLKDASSIRKLIAEGNLVAQKFPPGATHRAIWLVDRQSLAALKEKRRQRRAGGGKGRPPK